MTDITAPSLMQDIFRNVKTIAVVGASQNPARPSFMVMDYLIAHGFQVFAVNPGLAGQRILGQKVVATLSDIDTPINMVDIFRNSEAAAAVVDDALKMSPLPQVIWMQIGVYHLAAAQRAEALNIKVVMDRCVKIEHQRFLAQQL